MTVSYLKGDEGREYEENYFALVNKIFNFKNKYLNIAMVYKKKDKICESRDLNLDFIVFHCFSLLLSLKMIFPQALFSSFRKPTFSYIRIKLRFISKFRKFVKLYSQQQL